MENSVPAPDMNNAMKRINSVDQEIIETLISTQAINFEGIGKTISSVGAQAIFLDDDWIRWCGSDLRIFRWPGPRAELEQLANIRSLLKGSGG